MYFSKSRLWLTVLGAALAFRVQAQQTIIFSKPSDLPANKSASFLPGSQHQAGNYNAPRHLFNVDDTEDLPLPQAQVSNNNDPSVRDALNKRKNWTLLTPEQILGIQTPEQILGVPDKTGEKNLSLEEQYLLRESRSTAMLSTAATNGHSSAPLWRDTPEANPFETKSKSDEIPTFRQSLVKSEMDTRSFGHFLNTANSANSGLRPDEKLNANWNSVFIQPRQPKPTEDQLAGMERFRTLMEPNSPPDKTPVPTRFSATPAPAPDPYLQPMPAVNPAGRGIPSLANEFSSPGGIKPLPGIATQPPKPVATRPSSQAQLPPWMRDDPPAHNPNRNF